MKRWCSWCEYIRVCLSVVGRVGGGVLSIYHQIFRQQKHLLNPLVLLFLLGWWWFVLSSFSQSFTNSILKRCFNWKRKTNDLHLSCLLRFYSFHILHFYMATLLSVHIFFTHTPWPKFEYEKNGIERKHCVKEVEMVCKHVTNIKCR